MAFNTTIANALDQLSPTNAPAGVTKADINYVINLDCGAASGYSDCPIDVIGLQTQFNDLQLMTLKITVQGAPGCQGAKRPVLSGTYDYSDPSAPPAAPVLLARAYNEVRVNAVRVWQGYVWLP